MRLTRSLQKALHKFEKYVRYTPTPLSLADMSIFGTKTGTEQSSFEFLRRELPVRLANIMKEMNQLPEPMLNIPSIKTVNNWYEMSFSEILGFESADPKNQETLSNFADTLVNIRNRHANVVETMAQGFMELKEKNGLENTDPQLIQYFFNRFYTNRISIRMLINQHALLYGSQIGNHPRHIGCIDPKCDVLEVVKDAYANARFLCEEYYLCAPEIEFQTINKHEEEYISIVYVPSHLYHMVFELFKNALRAVVEYHTDEDSVPGPLPKIKVCICKGNEDLTIKMSDQGGGIPFNKIDKLFEYTYSTAPRPSIACRGSGSAPLAGYGYGLPLSRLYAQYFQGDLTLTSMEGYGTDAHIYLKVLSNEANECLPVYNKTSLRMYESDVAIPDWTTRKKN